MFRLELADSSAGKGTFLGLFYTQGEADAVVSLMENTAADGEALRVVETDEGEYDT